MDTYSTKTEDEIREAVFKKAQELDVPVVKEQIKMFVRGTAYARLDQHRGSLHRAFEPAGLSLDLNFDPSSANRSVF